MFGRSTTDTEITEASYGPKNRRKGNDFHIGSLNVRSISDQSKAEAFDLLAVNSGCKVIALQETKRKEGEWILSSGAELICTRREAREGGLAFWIHKDWLDSLVETKRESDRISTASFDFHGSHLHVINVYAPTSAANETQSDKFYKDLKKVYTRLSKWDSSIIICGDFNAVVGCSSDDLPFVGGHGTGQRSDNGDRLVNFAFSSRVSILNTIYPKRPNRKWTWISPNGKTKNEIDFILTNRREIAVDCEVYCDYLNCSDHRLLRARFRSTAKKEKSRKFAKTKRTGGEGSWDPVRFKNTITEMLTENPPTCYEELTESIRSAASTATHATHQLSRISEATKKMMLSRFQMIHAGQTKNADLAKINNENMVRHRLPSSTYYTPAGELEWSREQFGEQSIAVLSGAYRNPIEMARHVAASCGSHQPFFVMDVAAIERRLEALRVCFPRLRPSYAVACNADPVLARVLANNEDVSFEVANSAELEMAAMHVEPTRAVFCSQLMTRKGIRTAVAAGCATFVVEKWDPRGSARPRGRPPKRWADDITDSIKIFIHNEALRGNLGHGRRRIGILEARRAWSTVGRDRVTWRSLVRSIQDGN
uniref:Endonuclease/exonuclease/phosphatase domain-containing protein n=1 Tax=Caenorhabditis japonica TaxID=281687 RepID=A0A8R1EIW5_CAEJA